MTVGHSSGSMGEKSRGVKTRGFAPIAALALSLCLTTATTLNAASAATSSGNKPVGTMLLPLTPKLAEPAANEQGTANESGSNTGASEPNNQATAGDDPRSAASDQGNSYSPPSGTLLLPLTPKLDQQAAQQADRAAEGSTSSASSDSDAVLPEPSALKPAPSEITPERGNTVESAGIDEFADNNKLLKGTVQIVADDTEYDEASNTFLGTGNAVAIIAGENSKLEADMILYSQADQTIDARGNVKIYRQGQLTTGSAFKFKVTSDEYLITNPDTAVQGSQILARQARGTNKGIAFKDGSVSLPQPFFMMKNAYFGPTSYRDELQEKKAHPEAFLPQKPSWHITARKMVYERYKEAGNLTVFGGKLYIGNSKFGIPFGKMVLTAGAQDNRILFPVTPQFGSNLQVGGNNIGPTFHSAIGRTGVLSWAPLLQIGGTRLDGSKGSGIGLGGQVSFNNKYLSSHLAYGTTNNILVADFKARIYKNFRLQTGVNRFLDDGMFGLTRARFMGELVDNHTITKVPLLSSVNFRTSAGIGVDNPQLLNLSPNYKKLFGSTEANKTQITTALRVQEQITAQSQPLFSIGDSRLGLKSYIYGGVAMRGYSTGDHMIMGQAGPVLDAHLGKVRLQTGYTQTGVNGKSPFVFDQFIQGQRSAFLQGDIKLCKYLTLGGSVGYNLDIKQYYGKTISAAIGPEDFKLLIMEDTVRGTSRLGFDVLYGQPIPFQKLVLKGNPDRGQLGGI